MIIKQYQLMPASEEFLPEVSHIMTLFNIPRAENPQPETTPARAAAEIGICIERQSSLTVTVTVHYCDDTGAIGSDSQRHARVYPDEKPDLAVKRLIRLNLLAVMRRLTGLKPEPWGILQGVRPTKIIHQLLDRSMETGAIVERMREGYAVDETKVRLLTQIAARQRPFFIHTQPQRTVSVYIGIPYCPTRCLYCSFPAYVLPAAKDVDIFLTALQQDIQDAAALIHRYQWIVESIYIGGGTPTSLDNETFVRLLELVKAAFAANNPSCEITVEAGRPDSMTEEKLLALKRYAVARVSVNPQTMNEKTLQHIGRKHSVQAIIDMFADMRRIGIPVINMDIIAGLPGETVGDMAHTLNKIGELQPDNLTVHTLAIKKGSGLKAGLSDRPALQQQPVAPIANDMLNLAAQWAKDRNMQPYYLYRQKYMAGNLENVGYAKPGTECRYNIQVMEERQTIIGIGPAAATKAVDPDSRQLKRAYHPKDVHAYIKRLDHCLYVRNQLLTECFAKGESALC